MEKTVAVFVFCILPFGTLAADNSEFEPFDGEYRIGSVSVIDAAPDEKLDRVYIMVRRNAAKAIYDAMLVPAVPSPCDSTGIARSKTAGGLECYYSGRDYQCSVAIQLDTGETKIGAVC